MGLLTPRMPPFDLDQWARKPYRERLRLMCQDWALQGFGVPPAIYAFYLVKIVVYVGVWALFVAATPGIGGLGDIGTWWAEPIAFQKAVIWTLAFEVLGLGAASGPLTARYLPPFGGFLYFLRPGTTRLPPWPDRVPLTGGHRRTFVDALLYLAILALAFRALAAPEMTRDVLLPLAVAVPLAGLRDKTIYLAARSEHYWITLLVFLFPDDLISGSKAVQIGLWWGAATSKLNHHFGSVITVMVSNSPVLRWRRLRRAMYRDFPEDMRPSRLADALAHGGTALEYTFPAVLLFTSGGWPTTLALVAMVAFHLYITSCVPMGVPIEWNVFFIYSGLALFGVHADVSVFSIDSPLLIAILVTSLILVPALGNARPDLVSFLPSMRYYAGNWATSLWLFRKGREHELDEHLTKPARIWQQQLRVFYDDLTATAVQHKALAFRSMHLHGRALNDLLGRAVDDVEAYEINDGEWIAGVVVGWNFGDGHLHHEQLLDAVQDACGFAEGELVCIFLESQPIQRQAHHYRIVDAATGLLEQGHVEIRGMLASQPWPDGDHEVAPDTAPLQKDAP